MEHVRIAGRLCGWVAAEWDPVIAPFTISLSANWSPEYNSLFGKVTFGYRAKKCPNFRVTLKFVTLFTKACHCIPPWQRILQSTRHSTTASRSYSYFYVGFLNGSFASSVRNSILHKLTCTFIVYNMHATCSATRIFVRNVHEFGGLLIVKHLIMPLAQTFCFLLPVSSNTRPPSAV
jgi:hypothetical protein